MRCHDRTRQHAAYWSREDSGHEGKVETVHVDRRIQKLEWRLKMWLVCYMAVRPNNSKRWFLQSVFLNMISLKVNGICLQVSIIHSKLRSAPTWPSSAPGRSHTSPLGPLFVSGVQTGILLLQILWSRKLGVCIYPSCHRWILCFLTYTRCRCLCFLSVGLYSWPQSAHLTWM